MKTIPKRAIAATLSLIVFLAMFVGTTYAWFNATSSVRLDVGESATLSVDIVNEDGESVKDTIIGFTNLGPGKYWEPGSVFISSPVFVKNAGNVAVKCRLEVTGVEGNSELMDVIDWTVKIGDTEINLDDYEVIINAGETSDKAVTVIGTMDKDADNDYQGLKASGISLDVRAAQAAVEYDSNGNTYDIDAEYDNGAAESATKHLVTFYNYNGDILKVAEVKDGKNAVPPSDPKREGYTFKGWEGNYTNVTKNESVFATYEAVDPATATFVVLFKDYDGTVLKSQQVEIGNAATAPANPTREGYTFTGWDDAFSNITADTIITAQYKENSKEPTITVSSVSANAGDTVEVKVLISNNPGIAGAILKVSYDSNLKLTDSNVGSAFSTLSYTKPGVYSNPCNFTWDSESGMSTSNGTIVTLTFTVDDGVESGDKLAINCSYNKGDVYDENLKDVSLNMVNGYVIVK